MKSALFIVPTIPAIDEERDRLRPIGRNNEHPQRMIEQAREFAAFTDQADFDALALTEYRFYSKALELA